MLGGLREHGNGERDCRICRVPGGHEETHFAGAATGPTSRGGLGARQEWKPGPLTTTLLFDHLDFMFHFLRGKERRGMGQLSCFLSKSISSDVFTKHFV